MCQHQLNSKGHVYRYYPDIIESVRVYDYSQLIGQIPIKVNENRFFESGYYFTDPTFFSLFSFNFIQGSLIAALDNPNAVVITERIADKYFGDEDPMGKTLSIINGDDYMVSGIIENIPENSHLHFDFISPINPLIEKYTWMQRWNIPHFSTYIMLSKSNNSAEVNKKILGHVKKYDPEFYKFLGSTYALEPLADIHINAHHDQV
ncbi:MAG: ABC transporter permease [Bacteroidetes bacterium]|nr:ABC transporter permease [Bacteroidota bacterium]MBT4411396.1 ABC transporter permease [Bacteroidota bacterium]MBT7464979.1 ABC transporter permease [Bacteroidota bacterium]